MRGARTGRGRPAHTKPRSRAGYLDSDCGRFLKEGELATFEYVDWFNHQRLYEACGDIPPAELEDVYYRQNNRVTEAALSET